METPSKTSSLSRMALGALDVNSHLKSPRTGSTSHKPLSPTRKDNSSFVYKEVPNKNMYSLKDSDTPAPAPQSPRRAMFGTVEQTPSKSGEKRKQAPTSAAHGADEAERTVKQAMLYQGHSRQSSNAAGHGHGHSRQSSASGHGHKLFGEIPKSVMAEQDPLDADSSQDTVANSSSNDEEVGNASQLTAVSAPDVEGASPPRGSRSPDELRNVSIYHTHTNRNSTLLECEWREKTSRS